MSDYSSSGSSSGDDSDEELFDVCMPRVYKFQVTPDRIPALEATPPGAYHARGGAGGASESLVWDPTRLTAEALAPFLLYARRVHTTLSMAQLLDLIRECNYDLKAAQFALLQPLVAPAAAINAVNVGDLHDEVHETLARLYAHQHVKQTAAAAAAATGIFAPPADSSAVISTVSKANEVAEEKAWNERIARATEAVNATLHSLLASNKKFDLNYVNGLPSTTAGPARKGAAAKALAARGKKSKAPSSDDSANESDGADEAAVKSEAEGSEAEEVPMSVVGPSTTGASSSSSKQSASVHPLDASFIYPWLQVSGFPTRTPAASLIDFSKLRDYVQVLDDPISGGAPLTTPELTIQRTALLAIPRAHLDFLVELFEAKTEWLERAGPILNHISRGRDNQTMEGVLELLRDLEQQAPTIDSRQRRKCINIVSRVQEWRVRAQVAFTQASSKSSLHNQGLLPYGAAIHGRQAAASPAAAAAGRSASPATGLPLSAAPAGSVPFTLSLLNALVKECDKCCGTVQTDESVFLRSVTDFACNFARQVDTLLACRVEPEAIQAAKAEVEGKTAAATTANGVKKEATGGEEEKADSSNGMEVDEAGDDHSSEADADADAENGNPRRGGRVTTNNRASPSPSPAAATVAAEPGLSNDYPTDPSALPAKMSLQHARVLLARFSSRFAFHFRIYQTALLKNEIARTEQWVLDTQAILTRTRNQHQAEGAGGETLQQWLDQLSALLATSEALAIAVEPTQLEPLVKGLRSRIWAAKVDRAFEVEPTLVAAAAAGTNDADSEEKRPAAARSPAGGAGAVRRGPALQSVYDLLEEAVGIPIVPTVARYAKLEGLIAQAQQLISEATTLFSLKGSSKVSVREWQALLDRIRLLPVHLEEEGRIERVIANTNEWHRKATAMLRDARASTPSPTPAGSSSSSSSSRVAPHAISFQEIESLLHRTTHGKAIALISDACADPRDNSAVYTDLMSYLKIGRSWCEEVTLCFKNLSAVGSKKAAAAHTVPGSGSNAKKSSGGAGASAAQQHDGMDRYATMERLKQLLGLYTSRDAEIVEDEDDQEEATHSEHEGEEKKEDEKKDVEMTTEAGAPAAATPAAAAASADCPPSAAAPPSLPSTDPASWSWLARYSIAPATFESLLPHLHLKMADSLSERLNLVSECLAMAWTAIRGPKKSSIVQLHKLVNQLQQSGELATAEPLRTLQARLKFAVRWRNQARQALPDAWLNEIKRKQRRRLGRESGALLSSMPSIHMRGGRRTRKKPSGPIAPHSEEAAADDDSDNDQEEDMRARESSLDAFRFSDDEDEAPAGPEDDHAGEEGESTKSYKCTLGELQDLNHVFDRFVAYRQQHPETGPATFPPASRPTTPNTSAASPLTVDSAEVDSENLTLGLDLVELDERDALQKCIDECIAWQAKARATLAQPTCVALADRLAQVQPMYSEPQSAAAGVDGSAVIEVPAASLLLQSPLAGEEESIAAMKSVLAEFEDEEVFVPEMQQLAHLTWAKDWIHQAHQVLAQCAAAAHASAAGKEEIHSSMAASAAVAAAAASSTDANVAAPAAAPVDGDVAMDIIHSELAPAVAPLSAIAPVPGAVPLAALVSLLRALRSHFGSSSYTPLLFHMQFLRSAAGRRGAAGLMMPKEESEDEKEEDIADEEEKEEGAEEKEETKEEGAANGQAEPMAVEAAAASVPTPAVAAADTPVVKMETDEPIAAVEPAVTAAAPASADEEDESESLALAHGEEKSAELDPFLQTFRHDIQHLEAYVHDVLSFSHRVRQLFERRLGVPHTNLLLGPQREELLLWLAEAADEAGATASAVGAPASVASEVAAPPAVGTGLLATCRRLRAAKQKEKSKSQKVAPLSISKAAGRGGRAKSTPVDAPVSEDAASGEAATPRGRDKPQRVRVKKEHADELVEDPASIARKRRERKSGKGGAAGATTAAASVAGVKDEPLAFGDLSLDVADADEGVVGEDDSTLHCLCQRPYVEGEVMISCDVCNLWFHTACLNLSKQDVKRVEESKFLCPACAKAAKKTFRYRDKIPHRKAKARGPKLATLVTLMAKAPRQTRCEEVERARAILDQAMEWTRRVDDMLDHPPTEQWQPPPTPTPQQPQIDAPTAAESNGAAPANGDVAMGDAPAPAVTVAPPPEPPAPAEPVHGTRRAGHPNPAAAAGASAGVSLASAGLPTRKDVETLLKLECVQRELWLKTRQAYTDALSDLLREGMGLPLELPGRKLLEERIRLLIHLEKAERILLDNVTVPLLPSSNAENDEADIAAATAVLEKAAEKEDEKETPLASASGGAPAAAGGPPSLSAGVAPSARERDQTPLTAHAKRHEYREIGLVHQELEKLHAAKYLEPVPQQNLVWPRIDTFYQRLQAWIEKTNLALYKLTASTLHSLLLLQTEYKNHFLMVVSPTFADLQKRLGNIVKWIPREKKALAKKYRASQLWKLQLERVTDCGLSTSPYTTKIQAECTRIEEWDKQLHWGMESKSGPQHFKALLKEAMEGEHPVLVDPKDITLCQGFTELYCWGEDTRVLTDRGFLFVHQLESLAADGAPVQYAAYDRLTHRLVYSAGTLVYPPTQDGALLSFTTVEESKRWTASGGDYGAPDDEGLASNYLSLRVTADHRMLVQPQGKGRNVPPHSLVDGAETMAAHEVKASSSGVRLLAHAPAGFEPVAADQSAFVAGLAESLGVVGAAQVDAFLAVYGFWLGDGSLSHTSTGCCQSVVFAQVKRGDVAWLEEQLAILGVEYGRGHHARHSFHCVTDPRWRAFFEAEYGAKYPKSARYAGPPSAATPDDDAAAEEQLELMAEVALPTALATLPNIAQAADVESDEASQPGDESAVIPSDAAPARSAREDKLSPAPKQMPKGDTTRCTLCHTHGAGPATQTMSKATTLKALPASHPPEYGVKSAKWLCDWVWQSLDSRRVRLVLEGIRRADDSCALPPGVLFTSSVRFRDELVRACYHAGYTATFRIGRRAGEMVPVAADKSMAARHDGWIVSYSDASSTNGRQSCWPALDTSSIESEVYTGKVWGVTVDHPDHLIFAQRAHVGVGGEVTKASRPVVVGNCLCQVHYQDGVFMIGCDGCGDWFHDSCVNLTQKVAEKIKKFICPRCCQKEGVPYKYGHVQLTPQREAHAAPPAAAPAVRDSHPPAGGASGPPAAHPTTATAIPATTVQQALVPTFASQAWHPGMEAMGGMVWPGAMGAGMTHQMMLAQQQQQQQQQHQQQAHANAQHQQQQQQAAAASAAANKKRKKSGPAGVAGDPAAAGAKKKRSAAAAHSAGADSDSDGGGGGGRKKKPKVRYDMPMPTGPDSTAPTAHALHEATLAASAAGVVGPMSLAVLQHEPLMGVPADAPPPRTAALYATLLYEHLHVQVSAENANVLWHLLNGYMNRMFDSRLEEEILEAAKLVAGEQLLTDALAVVNAIYTAQVQLQWRQQQHQQAQMIAIQNVRHAPRMQRQPQAQPTHDGGALAGGGASDSDEESDGQGGKKPGKRKPKNFPRPPLSAYKCFVRHLKNTPAPHPTGGAAPSSSKEVTLLHNMQTLADAQNKSLNKLMSEKWRQLAKDQRAIFDEECAQEKEKYDLAVHAWNQAKEEEAAAAPPALPTAHDHHEGDADVEMETQSAAAAAHAVPSGLPVVSPQAPVLKASSVHDSPAAGHVSMYPHRPVHVAAGVAQAIPSQAIVHTANVVHHHHHPMMAHFHHPYAQNPAMSAYWSQYSLQQQQHQQREMQMQQHQHAQQQQAAVAAVAAPPVAAAAAAIPAVSSQEPSVSPQQPSPQAQLSPQAEAVVPMQLQGM